MQLTYMCFFLITLVLIAPFMSVFFTIRFHSFLATTPPLLRCLNAACPVICVCVIYFMCVSIYNTPAHSELASHLCLSSDAAVRIVNTPDRTREDPTPQPSVPISGYVS